MQKEINSLESNNTWELMPKPKEAKVINTRQAYKLKPSYSDNSLEFKARFVAKGFKQLYKLEYINTFINIIKQLISRLLFALALIN